MNFAVVALVLVSCVLTESSSSIAGSTAEAAAAVATDRKLLVKILPNEQPKSVPFDSHLQLRSPDLRPSDPRITKQGPGCTLPEQVGHWQCQQQQQQRRCIGFK
jgi:hypothetical protein